jgi:hypothetical protein
MDASWNPRTLWSDAKTASIEGGAAADAEADGKRTSAEAARRKPTTCDLLTDDLR